MRRLQDDYSAALLVKGWYWSRLCTEYGAMITKIRVFWSWPNLKALAIGYWSCGRTLQAASHFCLDLRIIFKEIHRLLAAMQADFNIREAYVISSSAHCPKKPSAFCDRTGDAAAILNLPDEKFSPGKMPMVDALGR